MICNCGEGMASGVAAMSWDQPLDNGEPSDVAPASPAFVVGPENALVRYVDLLLRDWDASAVPVDNNPLVLCGAPGSGKSLLAQGLAARWMRQRPADSVLVTTTADFVRVLARAAKSDDLEHQRARFLSAALCVIDDVDQLAGKWFAQQELASICDLRSRRRRPLILTAATVPAELPKLLPRLSSRLYLGLCLLLRRPGPETCRFVIQRSAVDQDLELSAAEMDQLARSLSGATVQEIRARTLRYALSLRDATDRVDPLTAMAYRPASPANTIQQIVQLIAKDFGLRVSDITGKSRRRSVVRPRSLAIYLARKHSRASYKAIGRRFGGRDHTTIGHACRQAAASLATDRVLRKIATQIEARLPLAALPEGVGYAAPVSERAESVVMQRDT